MGDVRKVFKAVGGVTVALLLGYLSYFGGSDLVRSPRAAVTPAETKPGPAGWIPSRPDSLAPVVTETTFDGKEIAGPQDLPRLAGNTPLGKEVSLRVIREGRSLDLKATIREFREDATPS